MFVREKKNKKTKKSYLQIVENERIGSKVKQNVVLSLGCLQSLKASGELRKLANSLLKYCESDDASINDLQEERRLYWGMPKIIGSLWELFDFPGILEECSQHRALEFDFQHAIRLMIADRFASPCSKLKSYERQGEYADTQAVPLHHLYRALDCLADFKEQIEQRLFEKNRALFNMRVDIVFYDVTTFYFESQTADDLRDRGFSKDNKIDEVQVVLGLLVDMNGRPIGYELFPGNIYEGHTLRAAIDTLKQRFAIQKLILVADRGMLSADNLEIIRTSGYEYIISCRLKKLGKTLQEQVLDLDSYTDMPQETPADTQSDEEPAINKYKIMMPENVFGDVLAALRNQQSAPDVYRAIRKITKRVTDQQLKATLRGFRHEPFTSEACQKLTKTIEDYLAQRWILTWSSQRAKRDKAKRDLLVEKAQQITAGSVQLLSQRGPRRYLQLASQEVSLDHTRIEQESRWDGFYGICTNNPELHWQTILEHYHCLWRIEESFRILKSHFETRPMFHWTAKRIKGHLVLCFIALLFERTLELELKQRQVPYSPTKIREAINSLQLSVVESRGQQFHLYAKINTLAREILKICRIKVPPKLAPAQQVREPQEISS
ncbi:MAG: IS1634 family transposase [Deltaproteobacteria bacterium]|nr:IS1634 family transposase [Deltaproteobacteria bacterium]